MVHGINRKVTKDKSHSMFGQNEKYEFVETFLSPNFYHVLRELSRGPVGKTVHIGAPKVDVRSVCKREREREREEYKTV